MSRINLIDRFLRAANQAEVDELNEKARKCNFTPEDTAEYVIECLRKMPYKEFLKTSYWIDIKRAKLHEAKHKCSVCNSNAKLNVHHKTYANHGRELEHPEDLVVLCEDCHAIFHHKLWEEK